MIHALVEVEKNIKNAVGRGKVEEFLLLQTLFTDRNRGVGGLLPHFETNVMVNEVLLDWLVQIYWDLVGAIMSKDDPQHSSVPSGHTAFFVVGL